MPPRTWSTGLGATALEAKSSTPQEPATLLKTGHDSWGPNVQQIGFNADS